jgi:glycosyltransferase involved in cell wall biosynthesis
VGAALRTDVQAALLSGAGGSLTGMAQPDLSILLPAYNEAPNLPEVLEELVGTLEPTGMTFEIVVVDDGSTDGSVDVLRKCGERFSQLRWIHVRRNAGKSDALQSGFEIVRGHNVILMDADGQDAPSAIPVLLDALDGGLDLVTGRRAQRNDRFIKRSTSKFYNWFTAKLTGVEGRDFNSGLKAMRQEVVGELDMYGEMHRYIPVLAAAKGFDVGEVDVPHRARLHGTSKFGRDRFWRGFFDLITVKFLTTYNKRPFHILGGLGLGCGVFGIGLLTWMFVDKVRGEIIGNRPALLGGILFVLVGAQLVSLGLLAELIVSRTRQRERSRPPISASGGFDAPLQRQAGGVS